VLIGLMALSLIISLRLKESAMMAREIGIEAEIPKVA